MLFPNTARQITAYERCGCAVLTLALVLTTVVTIPAAASEPAKPAISRSALMGLAQKFVDRVGPGLKEADRKMMTAPVPVDSVEARRRRAFDSIPDGEELLLQVRIDKLDVNQTIMGIKRGNDIMLSLSDFSIASGFALSVDAQKQIVDGFFIRENQKFLLDVAAGKVVAEDRTYTLQPGDVEVQDYDILARSGKMAEWFGFTVSPDLSMQQLNIASGKKWPIQERFDRLRKKENPVAEIDPGPKLPEMKMDYKQISVPNVDFNMQQSYISDPGEDKAIKDTRYGIQASGDLLGHTATTSISGNENEKLNAVYLNMKKDSDKPDLLGPLKARRYEFGDINTVIVPYAGSAPSELGVRASNRNPFVTSATTTRIAGYGTVGWDVELYRNDQYLSILTVDDSGQYVFNDVPLVFGLNKFRIVQYGPQGELREEEQLVTVDPNVYSAGGIGAYDVSASLQNTQTWQAVPQEDKDKYSPHFAATLARQIAKDTSGHIGLRTRQENEEQKAYGNAGIATTIKGALVNADVAVDDLGNYMGIATARKTVKRQNFGASAFYTSENFNPGVVLNNKPSQLAISTFSAGPIPYVDSLNYNYEWNSGYVFSGDGTRNFTDQLSLNARIKKLFLNNILNHNNTTFANGDSEDTIDGNFSVRGRALNKTLLRAGVGYELKPDAFISDYRVGASRQLTKSLHGDVGLKHDVVENYTIAEAALDWDGENVNISPSLSFDTDSVLDAKVNLRFGLTRDPYTGSILMRGKTNSNNGGVSVRVFLDRDGDSVYTEGDELLEGVTVRAIQANREIETDKNGEVFIYNLAAGELTDVIVEEGGAMDATWITGFPGASVRPRPGQVARLEFPIHMSGEIDGTLYAQTAGKPRPLKNVHLSLYDQDGKAKMRTITGSDGFYLFELIPPGKYLLIPDANDLKVARVQGVPPQEITIGYDGTIIYGNNITLPLGTGSGLDVVSMTEFTDTNPGAEVAGAQNVVLNLGSYYSQVTETVVWYRLKRRYDSIIGGLPLLSRMGRDVASGKDGLYTLRLRLASDDVEDAFRRCRALSARDIFCKVEYIVGRQPDKSAEVAGTPKGG